MGYIEVVKIDPHILKIKLNRPAVYNALNRRLLLELSATLEEVRHCSETRVVIITGGDVFCTGADLKERNAFTEDDVRLYIQLIRDTFTKIELLPQPVIAAIERYAFGGGLELALACDLRIAGESAVFGLLETSLGIIPGAGGTQRLPRIVGESKAKELIFLAKKISADQAMDMHLVNVISGDGAVFDAALDMAKAIANNAPLATRQAKRALCDGFGLSLQEGLAVETRAYERLISTQDRLEGLAAFKEKRAPQYIGQ